MPAAGPHVNSCMPAPPRKSLFRSLGEFFGHIGRAVAADPAKTTTVLRRETHERSVPVPPDASPGPQAKVTLRRTTIDEIEIDRGTPPS